MEFLSPSTKLRLEALEQENLDLKATIASERAKFNTSKKPVGYFLVIGLLMACCVYLYMKDSPMTSAELSGVRVELWKNGTATDTILTPNANVEYSVQIGSFKSLDFSELSKGFESADVLQKDSLSTLVIGRYNSLLEAQDLLDIVVKVGVENAYIVAYKNGKNVGLLSNKTTN